MILKTTALSAAVFSPLIAAGGDPGHDPLALGTWVLVAGGVLLILNQGATFIERFRKKEPLERNVTIQAKMLTENDLKTIENGSKERKADSDRKLREIREDAKVQDAKIDSLRAELTEMGAGIHERINALVNGQGELRGEMKHVAAAVAQAAANAQAAALKAEGAAARAGRRAGS